VKGEIMKEKFLSLPKAARFAIVVTSSFILFCCLCLLIFAIIPSDKTPTQVATAIGSPTSEIEPPVPPTNTAQPELLLTDTPSILETLPSTPTSAPKPTATPNSFSKLIVPAGELAQYLDTYSNYKEVFVTKIDGSIDARPNDLEELCLDWLYYRDKILEYTQAGNTDKANDARTAWNEINVWLDEYNENDVSIMFSIIENRNN
jgi:hypothetical protein